MDSMTTVSTVADEEMVEVMEEEMCENVPFENTLERMTMKRAITETDYAGKTREARAWDGATSEPLAKRERKDDVQFTTEREMVTRAWRMLIGHRHSAHLRQIPKECISSTDPVYQLIDLNGLQKEIDSDMIKTLEDFMLRFQLMFTNMFIFVHSSGIVRVYTKEMYNECYSEYERMLSQEMKAYHLYQKRGKHLMDSMFPANSGSEELLQPMDVQDVTSDVALNLIKEEQLNTTDASLNFDLPKKLQNAFYEATEVSSSSRHQQMSEEDSDIFNKQLMLTAWNAIINHTRSMTLRYIELYAERCTCFVQETHDFIRLKDELNGGKIQGPKEMLRKIMHLFANIAMMSSYGHPISVFAREMYQDTFAHCYRLLTTKVKSGHGSDPTTNCVIPDEEFFAEPSAKKRRY